MYKLTAENGRLCMSLQATPVGEDLCVILSGGDVPHIGCVTLSLHRSSLSDGKKSSCTTSVLNLVGHKDDEIIGYISQRLSTVLQRNVVVTGGIHMENITGEEIQVVKTLAEQLMERLVFTYKMP